MDSLWSVQGELALLTHDFKISDFQNHKRINVGYFTLLSLWQFVMAAVGKLHAFYLVL